MLLEAMLSAFKARGVPRVVLSTAHQNAAAQRLFARAQDGADVVARRLAAADVEIGHWNEYDYVIVNEVIADSLAVLRGILAAERHRGSRQTGMAEFARILQLGRTGKG